MTDSCSKCLDCPNLFSSARNERSISSTRAKSSGKTFPSSYIQGARDEYASCSAAPAFRHPYISPLVPQHSMLAARMRSPKPLHRVHEFPPARLE
ncbi:hypothetical protein I7I48_07389 [Histoplasma ohiense]|nr:hypothetical protein I7I48_07389 [Histoplasma ohiense (nom. inval.)]